MWLLAEDGAWDSWNGGWNGGIAMPVGMVRVGMVGLWPLYDWDVYPSEIAGYHPLTRMHIGSCHTGGTVTP